MAIVVLVGAPLVGSPEVVRLPAVLVPALALGVAAHRPWRWNKADWKALDTWVPTDRVMSLGALGLTLLLSWIVLTRFQSGEINGVDFTVYFDRPCFQTLQGPPAVRRNGGLSEIFAAERIRALRVLGNATRPVACTRSAPLRCVFSPFP
jgi:hypothetical protein